MSCLRAECEERVDVVRWSVITKNLVTKNQSQVTRVVMTNRLTPPTVPSAVRAGTAKSVLCGYKYMSPQHSSHQPLIMEMETVSKMSETNSTFTWKNWKQSYSDAVNTANASKIVKCY
jgi:hypothetical protein